jgi:hypothetical protein
VIEPRYHARSEETGHFQSHLGWNEGAPASSIISARRPNASQNTHEISPKDLNAQEDVFEYPSLEAIARVFDQYICKAIRRVVVQAGRITSWKASVTMGFPLWGGPVDCLMVLSQMREIGSGLGGRCRSTASFDSSALPTPKLSQLAAARGLGSGSSRQEQRATIRSIAQIRRCTTLSGLRPCGNEQRTSCTRVRSGSWCWTTGATYSAVSMLFSCRCSSSLWI